MLLERNHREPQLRIWISSGEAALMHWRKELRVIGEPRRMVLMPVTVADAGREHGLIGRFQCVDFVGQFLCGQQPFFQQQFENGSH